MSRRWNQGSGINLFSFQDVMASVIGILFVVVLLMAVSITEQSPAASNDDTDPASEQARKLAALRQECASLQESSGELAEKVKLCTGDEQKMLREVHELNRKLEVLSAAIVQQEKSDLDTVAAVNAKKQEMAAVEAELKSLQGRLKDLEHEKDAPRSVPNIAYILDEQAAGVTPWLVEIGGNRIRAAAKDGSTAVLTFGARDAETRRQQFLAWAAQQDRRSYYFVLLIKPSGLEQAEEIQKQLRTRGFDIGTDYLPEQWQAFE